MVVDKSNFYKDGIQHLAIPSQSEIPMLKPDLVDQLFSHSAIPMEFCRISAGVDFDWNKTFFAFFKGFSADYFLQCLCFSFDQTDRNYVKNIIDRWWKCEVIQEKDVIDCILIVEMEWNGMV